MNASMMIVSSENGLGVICLNRPKANAYTIEFMQAFNESIEQLEADTDVRVVLIKSNIPRFFCAGADIATFGDNDTNTNKVLVGLAQRATGLIEGSPKIYIAAINGHALGGGLEIALACDIRLGSDGDYFLGLPEIKLGLIPGNGGSQRLTRVVGESKSLELCVTGDNIGPKEGFRIGLLNKLISVECFEQEVCDYAARLGRGAPMAMAATKDAVVKGAGLSLSRALDLETELVDSLYDTHDAAEGFLAHRQNRAAKFAGN